MTPNFRLKNPDKPKEKVADAFFLALLQYITF